MANIVDSLKDKLGNLIYPKTLTRAVYEEGTNKRLDTTLQENKTDILSIETTVGDVAMTTSAQTVKGAINELDADIGNKSTLITIDKTNLVSAVNENREQINNLAAERKKYAKFAISANQSIPNNIVTQIIWGAKTSYNDEDFCEIDTAGRIKILKEGIYEINCNIAFDSLSSPVGYRNIWTEFLQTFMPATGVPTYTYNSYFKYCTVGTLLEARVRHNHGTAIDVIPSGTSCNVRRVV